MITSFFCQNCQIVIDYEEMIDAWGSWIVPKCIYCFYTLVPQEANSQWLAS